MKKLFAIAVVMLCCTATYSQESSEKGISARISIHKSGGKVIKKGIYHGKIGFNSVSQKIKIWNNGYFIEITALGKGIQVCPEVYVMGRQDNTGTLSSQEYNTIVAKVRESIDLGKTDGNFQESGFSCMWTNGEKSTNGDELVYGYLLIISDETSIVVDAQPIKK